MCGIFGVFNHKEASNLLYYGLHSLQHRGQESAGITTTDNDKLYHKCSMGLVNASFSEEEIKSLKGSKGIGHVRYSTTGDSKIENAQPILFEADGIPLSIVHNGNLINCGSSNLSDTKYFIQLIKSSNKKNLKDKILDAINQIKGAYSFLILSNKELFVIRDPLGIRPLCLGKLNNSYILSSESVGLSLIDAEYEREIQPGEMLIISKENIESIKYCNNVETKFCIFELIYFARPDSYICNQNVYNLRKLCGKKLFIEHPIDITTNTIVIPVPDSGVPAAIGLSHIGNIPFEMGLFRSHYIGRTFIEPHQKMRDLSVRCKLSANSFVLKNKDVVVVDDSIVRGTNSIKIIRMLKQAGCNSIHMRIACPPIKYPCYYGVDTPDSNKLIASSYSIEEICNIINADSLGYLSLDTLLDTASSLYYKTNKACKNIFCHACFTGEYPL